MAADWFEKYAKENPKGDNADTALSDAVLLRLGLGDEEHGIDDAARSAKTTAHRTRCRPRRSRSRSARTTPTRKTGKAARTALEGAIALFDKAAPDIQVQAHATLGKGLRARRRRMLGAKAEYAKVRSLWSDPAAR